MGAAGARAELEKRADELSFAWAAVRAASSLELRKTPH